MKFGLIGHPVGHSQSPRLFEEMYGGEHSYDLIDEEDFDKAWDIFIQGYDGINVTAPFKERALDKADILSPECIKTGATNLVVKTAKGTKAFNSDYLGIKAMLKDLGLTEGVALVIGFGGAGKAAATAAADLGLDIVICNRTTSKAEGIRPLEEVAILSSVADVTIYTLPVAIPALEEASFSCLVEANYRDPQAAGASARRYVPGTEWLKYQAITGFPILIEGHKQ